jgi:hypothetical protein
VLVLSGRIKPSSAFLCRAAIPTMSFFKRATVTLALASASATGTLGKLAPVAPGQYIVEFAEGSAVSPYISRFLSLFWQSNAC